MIHLEPLDHTQWQDLQKTKSPYTFAETEAHG